MAQAPSLSLARFTLRTQMSTNNETSELYKFVPIRGISAQLLFMPLLPAIQKVQ